MPCSAFLRKGSSSSHPHGPSFSLHQGGKALLTHRSTPFFPFCESVARAAFDWYQWFTIGFFSDLSTCFANLRSAPFFCSCTKLIEAAGFFLVAMESSIDFSIGGSSCTTRGFFFFFFF